MERQVFNTRLVLTLALFFFFFGLNVVINKELKSYLQLVFYIKGSIGEVIDILFYISYFFVAPVGGLLVRKYGYKKALLSGWVMTALACILIFISVQFHFFSLFLGAIVLSASGITIMQVAANLYIVLMGDPRSSAARLNLAQSFNALGPFAAALFGLVLHRYFNGPSYADEPLDIRMVGYAYLCIAFIMFSLLPMLVKAAIPDIDIDHIEPENLITSQRKRHVLHFSQLRLGAFAIFAYVGAQMAMGNHLRSLDPDKTLYYWGLALLGRVIGSYTLNFINPHWATTFAAAFNALLVVCCMLTPPEISLVLVISMGFFNSILFPTLFALGVRGLGRFALDGSVILIMFVSGGSLIPFNVSNFSAVSYAWAFVIPMICYLYIAYYGARLSKFENVKLGDEKPI